MSFETSSEEWDYPVNEERILPLDLVSAVLYPIVREDLFEKEGPDRSFLTKNRIQYVVWGFKFLKLKPGL